ncbi:protoporphyrinogen oxidase HemJ [Paralimibaculum aggregatum]|uniref:Protoporphyrinogen IX oxidase n=1 Tax=Paralimibaculum aggregatum TaxID=3036245 RepID=A0ABQ6LR28_9RHOB|nr:protoporphyrinogen oxidase HemJ [Limibaculum sp. NKW23]GMG83436.1 protoporphyrinogen oxidase HemJ [Limibaculum sp. NKW23]
MQDLLLEHYAWIKALHVISVIAWMAGIFYLPRLFVYHAEKAAPGSELSETFKAMELKLFRFIMGPAMSATWLFGLLMLWANGLDWLAASPWLHAKLVLVAAMTWFHHWLGARRKEFAADANTRSGRSYRLMNEVPTLLMAGIVILVIVQPF